MDRFADEKNSAAFIGTKMVIEPLVGITDTGNEGRLTFVTRIGGG